MANKDWQDAENEEMEFGEQIEPGRDLSQDDAEAMQENFATEDEGSLEPDAMEFGERLSSTDEVEAEDDFEAADADADADMPPDETQYKY